jgi:serine/threonine protein kinase
MNSEINKSEIGPLIGIGSYSKIYAYGSQKVIKIINKKNLITDLEKRLIKNEIEFHQKMGPIQNNKRESYVLNPIVHCYGVSEDTTSYYLILERFKYNLRQFILNPTNPKREPTVLWKILYQLTVGLKIVHALGYTHNDIKLENILIELRNESPIVRYCDYGLVLKKDEIVNEIIGTQHYLAPEIFAKTETETETQNGKQYTMKSDLWSLGLVFFELVFNYFPKYELIESDFAKLRDQHKNNTYFPIIKRMLTIDSDKRITIDELLMELDERKI